MGIVKSANLDFQDYIEKKQKKLKKFEKITKKYLQSKLPCDNITLALKNALYIWTASSVGRAPDS